MKYYLHRILEVLCQGSFWRELYQDGIEGVWKKTRSSSTAASKVTELNDKEINLGDGIIDSLYKRAQAAIRSGSTHATPFRLEAPQGQRAIGSGQSTTAPRVAPNAADLPGLSMPKSTTSALQCPGTEAAAPEDVDKRAAMWASLSGEPVVAQPSKATAKATATKSKKQRVTKESAKRSVEDRLCVCSMRHACS